MINSFQIVNSGEDSTDADTKNSAQQYIQQIKLSDLVEMKDLGSGGFGYVSLVKFRDPDFGKACMMPQQLALKRVFMGKSITHK